MYVWIVNEEFWYFWNHGCSPKEHFVRSSHMPFYQTPDYFGCVSYFDATLTLTLPETPKLPQPFVNVLKFAFWGWKFVEIHPRPQVQLAKHANSRSVMNSVSEMVEIAQISPIVEGRYM